MVEVCRGSSSFVVVLYAQSWRPECSSRLGLVTDHQPHTWRRTRSQLPPMIFLTSASV